MDYPGQISIAGRRAPVDAHRRAFCRTGGRSGCTDDLQLAVLYGVEWGIWSNEQAAQLREYLLRGGLLVMCDDFSGSEVGATKASTNGNIVDSMSKVFPNRPIEDIPVNYLLLVHLDDASGARLRQLFASRQTLRERSTAASRIGLHSRDNRIMVAICHNMDLATDGESERCD